MRRFSDALALGAVAVWLTIGVAGAQNPVQRPRVLSDAEVESAFVSKKPPLYTTWMHRNFVEGSGLFRLAIDERGIVNDVGVVRSTGMRELDAHTIKALKHWRAKPGAIRVFDVPVTYEAPTEFKPPHVLKPKENRTGARNDGSTLGGP
jgi:TonB family protein